MIAQASLDHERIAFGKARIAGLALDREQWPEAERLFREAMKLSEEVGRKDRIASDSVRLAKALAQQGRGTEGRCHAERAVVIYSELRSPELAWAQEVLDECLA